MTALLYAVLSLVLWGADPAPTPQAPASLIKELSDLLDAGDLARASELADRAVREYPSDAALLNVAGVVDAQQRRFASAERHFTAAIHADRRLTAAYANLGRLYQEHANEDPAAAQKALAVYRELLAIEPSHPDALFQAAYLSACAGDWSSSRVWLDRLPADLRQRPQTRAVLAVDAAGLGDRARAAEIARDIVGHPELTEQDVVAVLPALDRAKDDALTEQLFAALERRQLASAMSLRQLGLANMRLGRFDAARHFLERAFNGGAPRLPTLLDLARVAYKQRDFHGALGYLAHARELDASNAEVHFLFGLSCVELNLGAEAFDALTKAVALAPDNPYVNYAMGAVAIHRHEPSEALPYFETYVRLRPDDPRGRFALGAARFYSNDLEGARTDLQLAARSKDAAAGAYYFLAKIARQQDDLETARQQIARALDANSKYPDALAEQGLILTRLGEFAAAERSLHAALAADPENYAATVNLATLYARTRDPRRDELKARLDALQDRRAAAAQEFLRIVQVVQ